MKRYLSATSEPGDVIVYKLVGEAWAAIGPLNPRLDLRNHSPTGFAWGYNGSGPAQLALALLADHLDYPDNADRIVALYQQFKFRWICGRQRGLRFEMLSDEIADAVTLIEGDIRKAAAAIDQDKPEWIKPGVRYHFDFKPPAPAPAPANTRKHKRNRSK